VFGEDLVEAAVDVDDLLGVDLDVGRLASKRCTGSRGPLPGPRE
jgi:hypothetical protein